MLPESFLLLLKTQISFKLRERGVRGEGVTVHVYKIVKIYFARMPPAIKN